MGYIKKEALPTPVRPTNSAQKDRDVLQSHERARHASLNTASSSLCRYFEHARLHEPSSADRGAPASSDWNSSTPSVKTEPIELRLSRDKPLPSSAIRSEKKEVVLADPAPPSEVKQEEVIPKSSARQAVTKEPILSHPSKPQATKKESILSRSSPPPEVKKEPFLLRSLRPQNTKENKTLSRVSAPPVKKEQVLLRTSASLAVEIERSPQPSKFQSANKRIELPLRHVPKKEEELSHFSNTQQNRDEQVHQRLSHPSLVKKKHAPSASGHKKATSKSRGKRKRKISAPKQTVRSTKKEEPTVQTAPALCDSSSKPSLVLLPPQKRQRLQPRLQPPEPQVPSLPPFPAKTENPSFDEVVIVSERIVKKPLKQASKNVQSRAVRNVPQKRDEQDTELSSPAAVVTPQTEAEKELLIQEYALYVVERDEETKAITWVVCKFCPIYGCQRRQRPYIKAYHVPLCRPELDLHVEHEHQKIWKLFKNASKEQKQAVFYRKRMPLNHVLQRRIAELKLSWGMKSTFTDVQQTAWRERSKIAQRWKKSSHARKKVTVKALADGLGIDLTALRDDNNKTAKQKQSGEPRERSANDHMSKEKAQNRERQRRTELRQEAEHLEIEMNDRGSEYEVMSATTLNAAVERRKRHERRVTERHNDT